MTNLTAQEAYEEAVQRIKAWQPGETLNLAIKGLTEIPACIREIEPTELVFTAWRNGRIGYQDDYGRFEGANQLSDLSPLAGLTSLKSLDCKQTQVSDLGPLSGLTALQTLDCRHTRVSDLGPLSGLSALQTLDCGATQVSDLGPLSGLIALQRLACVSTQVSDLGPLSRLTALETLDCSRTQVSDLGPLSRLTTLQALNCSYTQVSDLGSRSGLTALETLDCSKTQVSDLGSLSGLTALRSLCCRDIPVSDLGPLSGLTALETLDCSRIQVRDLGSLSGLTALRSLYCRDIPVSDLGPLSGLTALETLDCSWTQVSDLAPLSGLIALKTLECSWTQVSDLGPLSGLTALQALECNETQVSDLAPLSGLTALEALECNETQVSDLAPLSGVTALQALDCSGTQVSELAPLSGLTTLEALECSWTQVSDLGPLSGVTALRTLYCNGTQVTDLGPLSELPNLALLYASDCDITTWSEEMFCREQLSELSLSKLQGIPTEVLSQNQMDNCADRLRAHLLDLGPDPVALGDAKLLVLGNGRVGKTQLSRTLLGDGYDPTVVSTHGIVVRSFDLAVGSAPEPRIQLWDFGGQEIYHSTHTMFMKSRGMYLLAWTPEHEDNDAHVVGGHTFRNHQLPYWLNQISAFAGEDAPLIVVQTQADTVRDRRTIPEYAQEAYGGFSDALLIDHSAKTGRGQDDLNEALLEAYQSIEKPLIGKTRFAVKRALEEMISEGNRRTMPLEEFAALCDTHGGVTRPVLFLETLHNAGVVFYRIGFFSGEIILDQQWAITAIYSVLERGTQTFAIIQSMQGKFQRPLLGGLQWDRDGYSSDEQDLFIRMMQACGICFEYERGTKHTPATYIAPDLLPETASPSWDGADAGATQARTYRAHPAALMRSVICAIGAVAGTKGEFWRTGLCVYEGTFQGWVRIEIALENVVSPQVTVKTSGKHAADLLTRVDRIVAREESRLGFTAVECDSPSPKRLPEVGDDRDESSLHFARPNDEESGWFFSYAQADERADQSHPVATFCEKVAREQGVKIRRDVDETRVGEAIEPFMRELSKGAKIYIWLTDNYLRSPFCMFELHEIWKRSELEATDSDAARKLFDERVEVILGDAKIRMESEIAEYIELWECEYELIKKDIDRRAKIDSTTLQKRDAIFQIKSNTGPILRYVGSRLRETNFDKLI